MNLKTTKTVDYCVEELYKLNEWYGKDKGLPSIILLTSARTRVVTLLTTLSTFVAEAKGDMKDKEAQYEFTFNKINMAYLGNNTIPMAKALAIQDTEDLKKASIDAYKYFTSLDYFYNKMSAVAEAMSQDIASIKAEYRQTTK